VIGREICRGDIKFKCRRCWSTKRAEERAKESVSVINGECACVRVCLGDMDLICYNLPSMLVPLEVGMNLSQNYVHSGNFPLVMDRHI